MGTAGDDEPVPSPERRDLSYEEIEPGEPIGRGGNADVTAARLADGTRVALKEPRFQGTIRTGTVEAFLEEAETWATIDDHAHVVGLVDWGGTPVPWIAMEHMDGGSLADRLVDGPLSVADAARIGRATCRAVRYAHRHGLVHLDLKPANVLFREVPDGPDVAKVGDWGLARFLAEHSGSIEGLSPQYAAPEQFDAGTYGDPDDFTDIYQVGAVVYEALTGRPPFEGTGVAVMHSVLDGEPDPPTTVDTSLPATADEVLLRALATEKSDRYETVVDLRRALEGLATGDSGTVTGGEERVPGAAGKETGRTGSKDAERSGSTAPDADPRRARGSGGSGGSTDTDPDPGGSSTGATGDDSGDDPGDDRPEGVVDFFNDTGGYGFVETDATDEDVFFHLEDTALDTVSEGDRVRLEIEQAAKGPRATHMERLDDDGRDETGTGPPAGDRVRGVVDFFNDTGGYGFIETDATDEDVFFHMEDIGGPDLEEGQEVEFVVEPREKGPVATDLLRL